MSEVYWSGKVEMIKSVSQTINRLNSRNGVGGGGGNSFPYPFRFPLFGVNLVLLFIKGSTSPRRGGGGLKLEV